MTLLQVRALHRKIQDDYETWARDAPHQWSKDDFFINSRPIFVTIHYGQNQEICIRNAFEQEADIWETERDYSKIKYLSIAIATEITYAIVLFIFITGYQWIDYGLGLESSLTKSHTTSTTS